MLDPELWQTWNAMYEAGHHDEGLRLAERQVEARPADPDLQLLLGMALLAVGRRDDSLAAVHRAIACGGDDAAILTQAASRCYYEGDLATARTCVDRAKKIMPRNFALSKELKEQDRHLARREKGLDREEHLSQSFNAEPSDRRAAIAFARHLVRIGRSHTAYYVVKRGLRYNPDDRSLRRLERKLAKVVPDEVRTDSEEWAASGEPTTNLAWRPPGGRSIQGENLSEAERNPPH